MDNGSKESYPARCERNIPSAPTIGGSSRKYLADTADKSRGQAANGIDSKQLLLGPSERTVGQEIRDKRAISMERYAGPRDLGNYLASGLS